METGPLPSPGEDFDQWVADKFDEIFFVKGILLIVSGY